MTDSDRYKLLSRVVRIANATHHPYASRLKSLTRFLSKTLQLTSVTIYLLDSESRHLCLKVSSAGPGTLLNINIPVGEPGAARCAAEKSALVHSPQSLHKDETQSGTEAEFLFLPVLELEEVTGVVALGLPEKNFLSVKTSAVFQDILSTLAGIIQGIRLSFSSIRRVKDLTILSELGQRLNRVLPPAELIPLVLQITNKLSVSRCTIIRLTGNTGLSAGVFNSCRPKVGPDLNELYRIEEFCSEKVLSSDTTFFASHPQPTDMFTTSYICVPLHFEKEILGTMTFLGHKEESVSCRNFDEEDRRLFESMATLISNALAGAATFQQLSRLSDENDKKLKELMLLYRVSNTMLSTIKLNKLIHLILTALTAGDNPFFDRAMLFLINERSGIMQGMLGVTRETSPGQISPLAEVADILASRWDISENDMIRQRNSEFNRLVMASRLELNKSLNVASRAVLEKRQFFVPQAAKEKRVDRDFVRRFGITSFAVAPLMARERVVGVIVVDNALGGKPITQDELRFLQLFTNQAGMAVENSILYNRIEDANRDLYEAQERLLQGERLATVGEMAAGIAHELNQRGHRPLSRCTPIPFHPPRGARPRTLGSHRRDRRGVQVRAARPAGFKSPGGVPRQAEGRRSTALPGSLPGGDQAAGFWRIHRRIPWRERAGSLRAGSQGLRPLHRPQSSLS